MRIAVVIPAYNAAAYLGHAIDSALAQSFTDWELVIVDDGSDDDTAELARAYVGRHSRLKLVRQDNSFIAGARNRGLAETTSSSEYVIFLDADDVWERDALAVLVRALETDPPAVAAHGLSRMIDLLGEPVDPGLLEMRGRHRWGIVAQRLAPWPVTEPTTLSVLAYQNCIYTTGQTLIRRSALEAAGPFDPAASPAEDWDMWLRLSQRGHIAFVDRVVLNWRSHEESTTRRLRRLVAPKHWYVRCKLLSSQEMSHGQRRIARTANFVWGSQLCSQRWRDAGRSLVHGRARLAARLLWFAASGYAQLIRGSPVPERTLSGPEGLRWV